MAAAVWACGALWAQGSGSVEAVGPAGGIREIPFVVTRSVDATLLDITHNVIVVKEVTRKGKEVVHELRYDSRLSLRADKKSELGQAKKKVELSDLKAGQYVRITWRPDDGVAVELKVIPPKKTV